MLGACLASLMCVAAALKLADVPGFAESLRTWTFFSDQAIRNATAIFVPSYELALGLTWWALPSGKKKLAAACMSYTLLLFAAVFSADAWTGGKPSCSCFGVILARAEMRDQVLWVMLRNATLATLGLVSWRLAPPPPPPGSPPARPPWVNRPGGVMDKAGPRGFTLLEVLIVIVIVAMLIGLVIVSLWRVRDSSKQSIMLSRLSQHVRVFQAYATDYRDLSPYLSDPARPVNQFVCRGDGVVLSGDYWSPAIYWHVAMCDSYYNGRSGGPAFHNPMIDPRVGGLFFYQPVFFSGADYWDPAKRTDADHLQWTPNAISGVLFPADKAWLVTEYMGLGRSQGPYFSTDHWSGMSFVDGHAQRVDAAGQSSRYPQAELVPPFGNFGPLYTLYGIRGRDVGK